MCELYSFVMFLAVNNLQLSSVQLGAGAEIGVMTEQNSSDAVDSAAFSCVASTFSYSTRIRPSRMSGKRKQCGDKDTNSDSFVDGHG